MAAAFIQSLEQNETCSSCHACLITEQQDRHHALEKLYPLRDLSDIGKVVLETQVNSPEGLCPGPLGLRHQPQQPSADRQ